MFPFSAMDAHCDVTYTFWIARGQHQMGTQHTTLLLVGRLSSCLC